MRKLLILLNLAFVLLLFVNSGFGQGKVLGKPQVFDYPIDRDNLHKENTNSRIRAPWVVVCDRDHATTFSEPNFIRPSSKLSFGEWYYVLEEKKDWIRLGKADIDATNLKIRRLIVDYGWVEKKSMLLWTEGLKDARTRIHRKAFLLNKVNEINQILELEKKEVVPIYTGPTTKEMRGSKTIYEFYFVMKREGNRTLLCKNAGYNPKYNQEDLIGWVDNTRLMPWNTRLCLEPNFDQDAFRERLNNSNVRVAAFGEPVAAEKYASTGDLNKENAFWLNDPVAVEDDQLAQENPRRFKGGVVRFPLFSDNLGENYYKTGVIGEITVRTLGQELEYINEINYSGILKSINNRENAKTNFNVFFLVEGTPGLKLAQSAIPSSIRDLRVLLSNVPNVRFGGAVYRDSPEAAEGRLFEIQPLTGDEASVINFFQNAAFSNWYDNDSYTAMNYGIHQGLVEAGFNSLHTNILILIGNSGDYSGYKPRKAIAMQKNDPSFLLPESVVEKLAEMNTHVIALQTKNYNDKESVTFLTQTKSLVLEAAKEQHNLYKGIGSFIPSITIPNPGYPMDSDYWEIVALKGGPTKGIIIHPGRNKSFTERQIKDHLYQGTKEILDYVSAFWYKIGKIAEDGASIAEVSAGEFAPASSKLIFELLRNKPGYNEEKGFLKEDVVKLTKNKYKLYAEVYIPKQIKGARYPAMSFVLFMPEDDLDQFVEILERLTYSLTLDPSEIREGLYNAFTSLVELYTGNEGLGGKETLDDLRAMMQGVNKEGLPPSGFNSFFLSDIMSPRKVSDEEIRRFAEYMVGKLSKLKRVQRLGKHYEFSYSAEENLYFWIPLEMTL